MITDIMSSGIDHPGESDFTSDAAALEVAVTSPGASGIPFANGNGESLFLAGENFLLTGAAINIPYGFGQGTGKAYIGVAWKNNTGDIVTIPELSGNSVLVFPGFCETLRFPPNGIYITCPKVLAPWFLYLSVIQVNVSQVNLPAVLDAQLFKVQFHLEINHTRPLIPGS